MKKRYLVLVIMTIAMISCGGGTGESTRQMVDSQMMTEIGGESYTVDVRYYMDEANGLTVYSDKNDVTDSNGDGLIFGVFEHNGKLQFDFVKNGERLGGQITDWKKSANAVTGTGELKPENGLGKGTKVSFELRL